MFATLRSDVFAGIVVFLVALPLCLGIATASGVEPFAGLMSGIIGGLVVALLSGSHLSVSGPAAGLVVIVVSAIASLGSFSAFLTAVLLAGALQFGLGMLRAGRFAAYVPTSVIKGMLAAIGILLIVKQLPLAAGLAPGAGAGASSAAAGAGTVAGTAGAALLPTPFGGVSVAAALVALASLVLLLGWETSALRRFRWVRAVPAPLAVVMLGIGVTLLLDAIAPSFALPTEHRVALRELESLGALVDAISLPDFTQIADPDVWGVALTLAIVASLETLLSLEAVQQIDPKRRAASPDRELKAQGIGNLLAGALGGLPITAVIVRSSANVHAGARSRWAAVIHGVLLLASVFVLTSMINLIPLACLAAILIHTGYKLAKPQLFLSVAREGFNRFAPFVATIIGVLATDLLVGIAIGLAASFALALRANVQRALTVAHHDDHYLLVFRKDISFLGKVQLNHCLKQIPNGATLIIDASRADFIDVDVREAVEAFAQEAPQRGITIERKHWPDRPTAAWGATRGSLGG
ncbi:MAG: sulfate transporter [Gammaproteobacteria bacterium]|nr:sulfate transporter [Gammaproteobacteria bacterium]